MAMAPLVGTTPIPKPDLGPNVVWQNGRLRLQPEAVAADPQAAVAAQPAAAQVLINRNIANRARSGQPTLRGYNRAPGQDVTGLPSVDGSTDDEGFGAEDLLIPGAIGAVATYLARRAFKNRARARTGVNSPEFGAPDNSTGGRYGAGTGESVGTGARYGIGTRESTIAPEKPPGTSLEPVSQDALEEQLRQREQQRYERRAYGVRSKVGAARGQGSTSTIIEGSEVPTGPRAGEPIDVEFEEVRPDPRALPAPDPANMPPSEAKTEEGYKAGRQRAENYRSSLERERQRGRASQYEADTRTGEPVPRQEGKSQIFPAGKTQQGEPVYEMKFTDPEGKETHGSFIRRKDGTAYIINVGREGGENKLGPAAIISMRNRILKVFPDVRGFSGERISGARAGARPTVTVPAQIPATTTEAPTAGVNRTIGVPNAPELDRGVLATILRSIGR